MKDKDKIIEKQSELITYLFIEYGDRFMDDKRYIKHKSELVTLKAEEVEQKEPRQNYHLNCDKCGDTFWSQEGFPKPQLCYKCEQKYTTEVEQPEITAVAPTREHQRG